MRWIAAHFLRYWHLGLILLVGAIGNAALASVVPLIIGILYQSAGKKHDLSQPAASR
jgi:hypothetical protein